MSEHYDPDIQAQKDYEALNADIALELNKAKKRITELESALREIANAANYTAPEDIEARLHNEVKVYAIARAALKGGDDE